MVSIEVHLLYDIARLEEKLLSSELSKRGLNVKLIKVNAIDLGSRVMDAVGLIRVAGRSRVLPLSFIYQEVGLGSINSFNSLIITHDKFLTLVKLSKAGVPIPRTALLLDYSGDGDAASALLKTPLIIKPTDGSWGRLVALANTVREAELILRSYREGPLLSQEYVKKPKRDIRVTVVGDRAVAAIYRYSDDWRTNTARGGLAVPVKIDPELEDISVKASTTVGATYSGVDVVESERGYLVIEVNGVPEFKNVQRVTGVNVAGEIAEEVARLITS
ncbi:MAG: lysine biosynthesis protein LysX [Caldivirga sp.]|uniref:lysine biosynthesis protein LysX n=1 Tax=Caldivirga sp. MU80 TaxID=1650354 RepID=UPI0009FBA0C6|nr:lysine biosynthesis protein LysX [Caldivirga sp. MU80]NAZ28098.1 lysine biosynthesis protein LysX [Caldivirga sp.]